MIVTATGAAGEFTCTSASSKDGHTIDVTANGGRGVCTCEDFRFRCQRMLDRDKLGVLANSVDKNTCKHILAVVLFIGQTVTARMQQKKREEIWKLEL